MERHTDSRLDENQNNSEWEKKLFENRKVETAKSYASVDAIEKVSQFQIKYLWIYSTVGSVANDHHIHND